MAFRKRFEEGIVKFNVKAKGRLEIQEVLEEYDGRSITLRVTDDAVYLFKISREGLSLEVSPESLPEEDMYLETNSEILRRMLEEKRLNPTDLLLGRIKWRNISLKEVSIVKRLLES